VTAGGGARTLKPGRRLVAAAAADTEQQRHQNENDSALDYGVV